MYDQWIALVILPDLVPKTFNANKLDVMCDTLGPHEVLHWVMQNTVDDTIAGLNDWGSQGIYFATSSHRVTRIVDENVSLADMYSEKVGEETVRGC